MRILVTGASGFVGGSFLRRFAERSDIELHGVARRPSDLPRYHRADLSRPFALALRPDVVIHAAALAAPWGTRRAYERHNVEATRRVVAWCERHGHPRLIHLSSSSVFYREHDQLDLTEEAPIGPTFVNDYARTKAASERVAAAYAGECVVVRPRAVFGAGDTVLFPRLLRAARAGRLPRLVRADGRHAVGDLIGIESLCDYLLRLADHPAPAPAYNLTNAEPVALEALLLDVLAQLGIPIPTRRVPLARAFAAAAVFETLWRTRLLPGEPPITRFGVGVLAYSKTFDVRRAVTDLGPPSTGLADGLERFVRWQREQDTPS